MGEMDEKEGRKGKGEIVGAFGRWGLCVCGFIDLK
jgi:hypothetical protein